MSLRKNTLTLNEIFKFPDENIITFVRRLFTSEPETISALKIQLDKCLATANKAIPYLEAQVTEGQYGHSDTRAEAIEKLHGWADGTMQEKVDQSFTKITDMTKQLSATFGIPLPEIPESKEQQEQRTKLRVLMKQMGDAYVIAELQKHKGDLMLAEITRLEATFTNLESKTPFTPAFHQPNKKTQIAQQLVAYSKTDLSFNLDAYKKLVKRAAEEKAVNCVATGSKKTALYFALEAQQYERAKILLTDGRADFNIPTQDGDTALKLVQQRMASTQSPDAIATLKEILDLMQPPLLENLQTCHNSF